MKAISRTFLGETTTIAYPHGNGFSPNGEELIFCRATDAAGRQPRLLARRLATGETRELPGLPEAESLRLPLEATISFDVALTKLRLVAIVRTHVWFLDLAPGAQWRQVFTPPAGGCLQDLPSISPDGRRCLVGVDSADGHAAVEIDLETAEARILFSHPWHANHFHYSPHDSAWIGYAHEGPATEVHDRCWAWHPSQAPAGKVAFDQFAISDDPSRPLAVGHERWAFHDLSAYVIAYAVSPAPKRGLYEMFADGRRPRLLWESNTAWHCNMDRSGRYAVMDTTAAWDPLPSTGREFEEGVARHLQADRERSLNRSDIVLLDLQARKETVLARVSRQKHPYHPHPALSLDARWLVYTDASPGSRGAWLLELDLG